jgi:hypothetical protein
VEEEMTTPADSDASFAPLLVAAQALLSRTLGTDVTLTLAECLTDEERRNTVLRCRVTDGLAAHPSSIIIKQVVSQDYRPDATDSWDTQRFFRDWTGAEFLTTIAPDAAHCPRFYGGDAALGFFLLEDLGVHHSLVEPLLGADPASAEGALLTFATRLGQMHAATIGTAERFEQLTSATNAALAVDVPKSCLRQANDLQMQATQLRAQIEQLGVPIAQHFDDAIGEICAIVAAPGDFLAYVHGDPCPDNVFFTDGQLRLIDFEFGHFGHALRDAAYGRMCFPTCWCANQLPATVVGRMEAVYRAELIAVCTAARDDRSFEAALVRMYGFWLIGILGWHFERALEEDDEWGIASVRSRIITRLEVFLEAATASDQLLGLRETALALREHLSKRWPDTTPLPVYPAFRV